MALDRSDLFNKLNKRIYDELIRYQEACYNQTVSDRRPGLPGGWDALVVTHAKNLAEIIADEVDTFVRSADVTPEKFNVNSSTIGISPSTFTGPPAPVPLQPAKVTIGDMN